MKIRYPSAARRVVMWLCSMFVARYNTCAAVQNGYKKDNENVNVNGGVYAKYKDEITRTCVG